MTESSSALFFCTILSKGVRKMLDQYTQTLQDQIGQLSKLLGASAPAAQSAPQAANQFDCVDGLDGARAFQQKMLAGTKRIVWDNQRDVFYVLVKDSNGVASRIQICSYTVELEKTPEEKYVSREDFNALVAKLDQLIGKETDNG